MVRAPFFALTMVSAIALATGRPVRAQAVADPGRSPDAAFVAKASDAAAVDAELATLAVTRARAAAVKAFAKRVLDAHTAIASELAAMGRTSPIAGAPRRAGPANASAPCGERGCGARRDEVRRGAAVAAAGRASTRRSSPRWSRAARRPWPCSKPSPATAATPRSRNGRPAAAGAARTARCGPRPAATPELVGQFRSLRSFRGSSRTARRRRSRTVHARPTAYPT